MVAHPNCCRVTMDVAEKTFSAAVRHADGPIYPKCKQAAVHLQADVFASTERSPDAAEHEPDVVFFESEARGNLLTIFVQPLGCDMHLDSFATRIRNGQGRFETEERLVLHTDLVGPLNHNCTGRIRVTVDDLLVPDHVAVRMDWIEVAPDCQLWIEQRWKDFVCNFNSVECSTRHLWIVGR